MYKLGYRVTYVGVKKFGGRVKGGVVNGGVENVRFVGIGVVRVDCVLFVLGFIESRYGLFDVG